MADLLGEWLLAWVPLSSPNSICLKCQLSIVLALASLRKPQLDEILTSKIIPSPVFLPITVHLLCPLSSSSIF